MSLKITGTVHWKTWSILSSRPWATLQQRARIPVIHDKSKISECNIPVEEKRTLWDTDDLANSDHHGLPPCSDVLFTAAGIRMIPHWGPQYKFQAQCWCPLWLRKWLHKVAGAYCCFMSLKRQYMKQKHCLRVLFTKTTLLRQPWSEQGFFKLLLSIGLHFAGIAIRLVLLFNFAML